MSHGTTISEDLANKIDGLVLAYLQRRKYTKSVESLCDESPTLSKLRDFPAFSGTSSQPLTTTLYDKTLEEIVYQFSNHSHFVNPLFFELGRQMNDLSKNFSNTLLDHCHAIPPNGSQPAVHSNTHRFYGHHSSSRARNRSTVARQKTATQHATRTTERQVDRIPAYDSRMGQFYPGPHILTADGGQPSFGNVPADQAMTTQVQQGVTPRRTPRGINFKENPQEFNPTEDQTTVTPPAEESSSAADQHEVVNGGKGNKDIMRSAPAPASTETAMDTSDVHPIEKEAREQETQEKRAEGTEQGTGNNLDLSLFNSSNHGDEGMNSMLSDEGASRRKKTPHRFGSAARRVVSAVDALVECANAEAHPEQQTAQMQSSNSHLSLLSNLEDVLDIWDYHNLPSNLEEMVGRYDQALHDFPAPNENAMDLHDDNNEEHREREHDSIQVSTPLPVTEASSTCSANLGRNEDDTTTAEYMQNDNVGGEDGCVVRTPLATASGLSCTSLDMETREQTEITKGFDETTNTAAPTTRSSSSTSSDCPGGNGEENIVGKPSPLQPIASLSANSLPAGEVPPVLSDTRIAADDGQTEPTGAEEVPSGEPQEIVPVSVLPSDEPVHPEGELSRESGEVSDQETETEKRKGKQVPKDSSPLAAVTSEPPSNQPPVEKSNEGIVFDEVSPEKDPEMDGTEPEKRRKKGEPDREPSPHFTEMQPTRPSSTVSATGSEKSLRSRRQGKSIGDREGLRDAVLFDGSARSRGGMRNARDVEDPRNQKEKAKRESTTMSDLFDDDSSDHRPSSRDSVGSKREKKEKEQRRREREMEAERRRDREMHNKQREREKDKRGRRSSPVRGRERRDETTRGAGGRVGQRVDERDRNERGRSREEKEAGRRRSVDEDSERGTRREPRRSEESEHVKRKREERRKREEAVEKKRLEDNRRREEAMREKKRREERERLMEEERRQDEIAEYERREKERRRQQEEQRRRVEEEREAAAEKERLEREMMGIEEDEALDRECEEAERRRRQAEEAAAKKAAEQQAAEKDGEMPEKERKGSRDESTTETVLEKKRVPDEEGGRRDETSLEKKRVPDDESPPDSKKKEQKKRVKSLEARLVESQRKKKQKAAAEGHESNEEEKNTPKAHRRRSPSPFASLPFLTKKLAPTTKIPKRSSGSSSNGGESQREPLPVVATEVEVETSFTESEVDLYRPERTGSAGLTGETSHSVFPLPSKAKSRHVSSENPSKPSEMVGTAKPDYADRNLLITSSIRGAALGCKFERAKENLKTSNSFAAASSSRQGAPSTRSIVDTSDVIRSEKRPVTPQSVLSGNGLKMKIQLPTTLQDTSAVLRGHGTAKRHRASSPDRSSFSGLPKKNLKMDPSEMLSILNKVRPKEKR